MKLDENLKIVLEITEDEKGIILHTIDNFKRKTFNDHRTGKHIKRQEAAGFIIQTRDMIRSNKIGKDLKLTPPETLKLNMLLRCVDEAAYQVKKRFMEKSKKYDKDEAEISFKLVNQLLRKDIVDKKYIDAICRTVIMLFKLEIIEENEKIKKIKKEQNRVFKKGD